MQLDPDKSVPDNIYKDTAIKIWNATFDYLDFD